MVADGLETGVVAGVLCLGAWMMRCLDSRTNPVSNHDNTVHIMVYDTLPSLTSTKGRSSRTAHLGDLDYGARMNWVKVVEGCRGFLGEQGV